MKVSQLAVEGEAEPFPLAAVPSLEWLGIVAVIGSAGGVADMADGGPARVLPHDAVVLGLVVVAEGLDHGTDLLVGVQKLFSAWIVGREPRRELAPVLQIELHAGHESGY